MGKGEEGRRVFEMIGEKKKRSEKRRKGRRELEEENGRGKEEEGRWKEGMMECYLAFPDRGH